MSEPRLIDLRTFDSPALRDAACVAFLAAALRQTVGLKQAAVFAGAGGSTPANAYALLSQQVLAWDRITVCLTDERMVPPEHPASNERMMRAQLLQDQAATASFARIQHMDVIDPPDACLLGMGDDGHFASLFPGDPQLSDALSPDNPPAIVAVAPGDNGAPPPQARVSMNLSALTGCGALALLVGGDAKLDILSAVLKGAPSSLYPIAAVIDHMPQPLTVFWSP